jgi:hypothetical protein
MVSALRGLSPAYNSRYQGIGFGRRPFLKSLLQPWRMMRG